MIWPLLAALLWAGSAGASDGSLTVLGAVGKAGDRVHVAVRYDGDADIAVRVDLQLASGLVPALGPDSIYHGTPAACTVNPDIDKDDTGFTLLPPFCHHYCTGFRAVVLDLLDVLTPLPDGAVLFTCEVVIEPGTEVGSYPITCTADGVGGEVDERGHSNDPGHAVPCLGAAIEVLPGGALPAPGCEHDADHDGVVKVPELVRAVHEALEGCK